MAETPDENKEPVKDSGQRLSRRTQIVLFSTIGVVVAAVVVVVLLLLTGNGEADDSVDTDTEPGEMNVTSPYDLYELPEDTGPGDVQKASLVSISLTSADGTADYFGLSSDTEPAKALMKAIAQAKEVGEAEEGEDTESDEGDEADDSTTTETEVSDDATPDSLITFLFPDRTTLSFVLYLEDGTIARGGRVWLVEGDLATLVDAAVSLHERQ